jgi:hypothetical protein
MKGLKKLTTNMMKFFGLRSPKEINEGWCYKWALAVFFATPGSKLYTSRAGHAFVKVGNRFYDSESIRGVKKPENLKYFKRTTRKGVTVRQSCRRFIEHWRAHGRSGLDSLEVKKLKKREFFE